MRISDWSSDVCSSDLGIHRQGPSEAFDLGTFEAVLRTNALGAFAGCQAAYPHLPAAGGGVIVNIGSHYDKMGVKYNAAYCASKAAIGAITRCLAVEWAKQGIRVVDVARSEEHTSELQSLM